MQNHQLLLTHPLLTCLDFVEAATDGLALGEVAAEVFHGSVFDLERLLARRSLRLSIAFREAWAEAVGGGGPAPSDVRRFLSLVDAHGAGAVRAAAACLSERVFAARTSREVLERSCRVFAEVERTLEASTEVVLSRLMALLRDRYGGGGGREERERGGVRLPRTAAEVLLEFEALRSSDPYLVLLEEWAGLDGASSSSYRDRVRAAAKVLDLPRRNPITGRSLVLSRDCADDVERGLLTAIEVLRSTLVWDWSLWRGDGGGRRVLVVGPAISGLRSPDEPPPPKWCRWLQDGAPPTRLLLDALPVGLYSRIVVVGADAPDPSSPLVAGCVVRVSTDGDSPPPPSAAWALGDSPPRSEEARWVPSVGARYGSRGPRAPLWARDVCFDMLLHLARAGQVPSGREGLSVFREFVVRYAHVRSLGRRVHATCLDRSSPDCLGEVVAMDSRRNVWTVLALLVTLDNLAPSRWGVTVFCSSRHLPFFERCILLLVPNARVEALDALDADEFSADEYNDLLTSEDFWARFEAQRVLTVQDDGLLCRRGLEDCPDLLDQPYVGAPWVDAPGNREMLGEAGVRADALVGNGGLSLRRTREVVRVCRESTLRKTSLFNHNSQPIPEDVFFSAEIASRQTDDPARLLRAARRFSFEQTPPLPPPTPAPLGFHKPWPYIPIDSFEAYLRDALREAAARRDDDAPHPPSPPPQLTTEEEAPALL